MRMNENQTELQSEWIRSIQISPTNPKHTEFFGIMQIESDRLWLESFGLKVRSSSDQFGLTRFIGLQVRIDFELASDWFGLKTNFG